MLNQCINRCIKKYTQFYSSTNNGVQTHRIVRLAPLDLPGQLQNNLHILALLKQNRICMNEEARIKLKFRMMVRAYLIALLIVGPILYVGFRLRYYVNIFQIYLVFLLRLTKYEPLQILLRNILKSLEIMLLIPLLSYIITLGEH